MLTFTDIVEHFQDRFELVIGLGTIVNSIWDLASSYIQAKKSLEYRFFSPAQNILEPRSFMENNSSLLFSRKNNAEDLIQLICKNDLSGIHDWINDFANSFSYNCDSKNLVYTLLYSVLARILSFCCDMNITTEHFEQEITSVFSSPEKFNTIDHVASWLYALCENICNCLQESVASYHQSLCESAASYIQTNYTNCNLSLLEIAEHVQITPSYLSTLFKKLRGQNISNYITDIRNEAACQLLKNTSLPLKIISSQVGYSNQYYFSSCFKKKMGMTPSAYRESA